MSDDKRTLKSPGRPKDIGNKGRSVYRGKCDVRLTKEEDAMLNQLAELNEVSRSDVMRRALNDYWKFNTEE